MRRAKEADYEGVAGIRGVIIPVGMSGASGFLGGKVVIDDPNEAKRRLLMAKVLLVHPGSYVLMLLGYYDKCIPGTQHSPSHSPGYRLYTRLRLSVAFLSVDFSSRNVLV